MGGRLDAACIETSYLNELTEQVQNKAKKKKEKKTLLPSEALGG